jgi:hypothetical protein
MENITLAVTGITTIEKLVLRFSKELPSKGIAWRNYEVLDAEQKALVDGMVPEENANGKPKAKFAKQYQVHFEDVDNGRKYLYDCKVTCFDGGNKPWSMYIPLLEQVGPKVSGEINMDEYFKIDDMFTAKLMKEEGERYWHINVETLERV